MSVRPPQALDRLSSLSSLGDSSAERRSPGHRRQPSDSSETTGLVQRCVIIQKDQHGFGFTVSGDRVVLVQSVRPGGGRHESRGAGGGPHHQGERHDGDQQFPPRGGEVDQV
ncbi:hypothetical protein Q9233_009081 [Columba guinea]|nr:hypothetical protein Q9233_009081 [Columba guinea]